MVDEVEEEISILIRQRWERIFDRRQCRFSNHHRFLNPNLAVAHHMDHNRGIGEGFRKQESAFVIHDFEVITGSNSGWAGSNCGTATIVTAKIVDSASGNFGELPELVGELFDKPFLLQEIEVISGRFT